MNTNKYEAFSKHLRELVSFFVTEPESVDVTFEKKENDLYVFTLHVLSKDLDNVLGKKNIIYDSILKVLKASCKVENLELNVNVIS